MRYRVLWMLLGVAVAWPAGAQQTTQEPDQEPAPQEAQTDTGEEEPWLGAEAPSPFVSIGYGQDEEDYRVGTLAATVPMRGGPRLNFSVDRGRTQDGDRVAFYRAGISSDPLADQVVRLDGIVRNTSGPRSREAQLQTRRFLQDWDLSFRLRGGRVSFKSPQEDGGTEEQKGHRVGTGLGLGYATGPFYLQVQGIEYFYRWEDQAPDDTGENGLPFFSDAGGGAGGRQGGSQREPVLTKRQGTATVTYFSGPWDWQLGAQRIVDTDTTDLNLVLLGTTYQTSGGHSLGLNLDIPTGGEPVFAQVVLGIQL